MDGWMDGWMDRWKDLFVSGRLRLTWNDGVSERTLAGFVRSLAFAACRKQWMVKERPPTPACAQPFLAPGLFLNLVLAILGLSSSFFFFLMCVVFFFHFNFTGV